MNESLQEKQECPPMACREMTTVEILRAKAKRLHLRAVQLDDIADAFEHLPESVQAMFASSIQQGAIYNQQGTL